MYISSSRIMSDVSLLTISSSEKRYAKRWI